MPRLGIMNIDTMQIVWEGSNVRSALDWRDEHDGINPSDDYRYVLVEWRDMPPHWRVVKPARVTQLLSMGRTE